MFDSIRLIPIRRQIIYSHLRLYQIANICSKSICAKNRFESKIYSEKKIPSRVLTRPIPNLHAYVEFPSELLLEALVLLPLLVRERLAHHVRVVLFR